MPALFDRLLDNHVVGRDELQAARAEAEASGRPLEQVLLEKGVPKCEILTGLSEHFGVPWVEYDEDLMVSAAVMKQIDPEQLKRSLWLPIAISDSHAEVIASRPDDPRVLAQIKSMLGVDAVDFRVAFPDDVLRIIENNQDLNPGFPPEAGRTPLAKTRTYLAGTRSSLAIQRTSMAKARTALAFLRTGISSITIGVALIKLFGGGIFLPLELLLLAIGVYAVMDGLIWYVPVRGQALKNQSYAEPANDGGGMSVLSTRNEVAGPEFVRSGTLTGAVDQRRGWRRLSPVMRRRFLASDRTDLAEGRTVNASLRTTMAQARTGLAFARTGVAFGGLGLGLLKKFPSVSWSYFDFFLILAGTVMVLEGFYWYLPGYRAGRDGLRGFITALHEDTIWDEVFPPLHRLREQAPPVSAAQAPGIWGTTGLALERTVLAERRNLMSRLRTVMAYSRTGLAFIRTGMSIAGVGATLFVLLLPNSLGWKVTPVILIATGLFLAGDGLRWSLGTEKVWREYPFCRGEFEIQLPDYGKPARKWGRVVFDDEL